METRRKNVIYCVKYLGLGSPDPLSFCNPSWESLQIGEKISRKDTFVRYVCRCDEQVISWTPSIKRMDYVLQLCMKASDNQKKTASKLDDRALLRYLYKLLDIFYEGIFVAIL